MGGNRIGFDELLRLGNVHAGNVDAGEHRGGAGIGRLASGLPRLE